MSDELAQALRALEEELHKPETWHDQTRIRTLLHPDFEEFGRSGGRYRREDVLRELPRRGNDAVVRADEFSVSRISDDVALVTYRSFYIDAAGDRTRLALRFSLWMKTSAGWQMRFHQGTPTDTM